MLEIQERRLPITKNIKSLRWLAKYLSKYRIMLFGVLVSLIITSGSVLLISEALKYFIDSGINSKNLANLDEGLGALFSLVIILAVFTFSRFFLITMVGERCITDIRRDIYNKILSLSPNYFEQNSSGDLLSRVSADTTILLQIISSSLSVTMRNCIMLIGGIAMMINISISLSTMLLVIIPIIIIPLVIMGRKLRLYSRNSQDRVADIIAYCEQTLNALKVVQSYTRESLEAIKYEFLLQDQLKTAFDRIALRGFLTALVISLVFGGIACTLWIGGYQVVSGKLSAGELSAFIYVAVVSAGAVAALSDVLGDLQKAAGASDRIYEFLHYKTTIKDPVKPVDPPIKRGTVEFKNVTFGYGLDGKHKILKDVSFKIKSGSVIALVGRSGVGKTTIFMLLERFYDIEKGQILVDDTDITQMRLSDLRQRFTYVPQEPILFSATVLDNILYGKPNATKEEVIEAAKKAGCHDFIMRLENKYDTYLGERGMKLSGGQKQRITIARAILNDPHILLLDEATSSLDSASEKLVKEGLENLMKGRTTIVIAHRFATVKNADRILVLGDGKIVEQGTHTQLMKKNGLYKELASLQFSEEKE